MIIETFHNSSMIECTVYDEEKEELDVEFSSGTTYRYSGVQKRVHEELVKADSTGKTFNELIKNEYDWEIIE